MSWIIVFGDQADDDERIENIDDFVGELYAYLVSLCVVSGSGVAWLGPRCLRGDRRELGSLRVSRVIVIVLIRALIDTCQKPEGS